MARTTGGRFGAFVFSAVGSFGAVSGRGRVGAVWLKAASDLGTVYGMSVNRKSPDLSTVYDWLSAAWFCRHLCRPAIDQSRKYLDAFGKLSWVDEFIRFVGLFD